MKPHIIIFPLVFLFGVFQAHKITKREEFLTSKDELLDYIESSKLIELTDNKSIEKIEALLDDIDTCRTKQDIDRMYQKSKELEYDLVGQKMKKVVGGN